MDELRFKFEILCPRSHRSIQIENLRIKLQSFTDAGFQCLNFILRNSVCNNVMTTDANTPTQD